MVVLECSWTLQTSRAAALAGTWYLLPYLCTAGLLQLWPRCGDLKGCVEEDNGVGGAMFNLSP